VTLADIAALASAVESFPLADVQAALANPANLGNDAQVVADVASLLATAFPQAEPVALGFEAAAVMLRFPARVPLSLAQTAASAETDGRYVGR